ncbi:hypothetical protein ABZV67_38690 [Streptomyces sp. NPDC005065]|uniref:hypothetical protein n=1 Tax=unclassified Streptomyces TaxID=2593676 RepID=UPI0033AEFAA2
MQFEDANWTWNRNIPLRYLLVSEEWDGEQTLWARCSNADRLFVDPVSRRESLTLVACAPTGRLLKAVERSAREPVDLGDLFVTVDFPDSHDDSRGGYWVHYWDLEHVLVVGSRPSPTDPLLLDVLIEAEVTGPTQPSYRPGPVREPKDAEVRINNGTGSRIGRCRRVEGLYADRPAPEVAPMRLIGCEPTGQLLERLVRPRTNGDPVELWAVDRTGRVIRTENRLTLHIADSRPSVLGGALIDISLREGLKHPPGLAARPVWDAWHDGAPGERNMWARYSPGGREEWLRFTSASPGADAGSTCHLDGRFVTDVAGLKCALGEAVAGPGRHLNLCWGMLKGCPCGGDNLPGRFTLVWHDSEIARHALASVSVDAAGELTYFESTVQYLRQLGTTVVLR